jgi:hypothetical protein
MLDIKFKAWDSKNKKWLEFVPPEEYMLDSEHWDSPDYGDMEEGMLFYPKNPLGHTFDGRIKYVQFTGKKDCDGADIYIGDIIKKTFKATASDWNGREILCIPGTKIIDVEEFFEVKGNPKDILGFYFDEKRHITIADNVKYKVAGNVFENEDLLK